MTRSHEVTLKKEQCRLDIIKLLLSQRTVNEWVLLVVVLIFFKLN